MNANPFGGGFRPSGPQTPGLEGGFASAVAAQALVSRTDSPGPSSAQLPAGGGSTGLGGGNRLLLSGNVRHTALWARTELYAGFERHARGGGQRGRRVGACRLHPRRGAAQPGDARGRAPRAQQEARAMGRPRARALAFVRSVGSRASDHDAHRLSSGVMSALLQEIVAVYPLLSPPSLTAHASNRVCNALALLQFVEGEMRTR